MKKQGYFSSDFTIYTITDMYPPRPWYNFIWNKNFIAQLDQFGMGNSWHYSKAGLRSNHNCKGSQYSGIKTSFKIFIPQEGSHECWQIKIKNSSNEKKNISCFPFANSSIGDFPHAACAHGFFDKELNGVILENNGPNLHTNLTKTFCRIIAKN